MSRILELRRKSKVEKKTIVLPEGEDLRVVKGASFLAKDELADVILLGKEQEVSSLAKENDIDMEGVQVVDPFTHDKKNEIIEEYFKLREKKGVTKEEAETLLLNNFVYYGAMMTRMDIVDGFVAGACHTTSDVARAAIHCLRLDKEIGTVCSSFIMEFDDCQFGESGLFAYGDCAVIPYPSQRQLSGIAVSTSDIFKKLFSIEPRVAMLSYSTKGSAKSETESIGIIHKALERIKKKRPNLIVDGELQVDAAVVPEIAKKKCPGSKVAGEANVLIFPNLDAGNISYKLSQRLGNARAVGPIIQGLDKPCSDLSRGCSWEDVVDTAVITAIRAQSL